MGSHLTSSKKLGARISLATLTAQLALGSLSFGFLPTSALAATTIFTDSFGTGITDTTFNESPVWTEGSVGAEKRAASSGVDSASPDGGRFALMQGNNGGGLDGWICRTMNAVGYNNLTLAYHWRGDDDSSSSSDDGIVEYKTTGSCSDTSGWTQLQNHDLRQDGSWTTQAAFAFPGGLANSSFLLRFRTDTNSSQDDFRVDGVVIQGDLLAIDADGDGVPDTSDNCPAVSNADQANNDGDAQGDVCDTDDDNDGVLDAAPDNCQFVSNAGQTNTDADAQGDACDADDDNDGVADGTDNCPLTSNADQAAHDADGLGDACDTDDDGDTVLDGSDNCSLVSNLDQANLDEDAEGDACDADDDNDSFADVVDNCPVIVNNPQTDTDEDGAGDACDADDDDDTVVDIEDNCPLVENTTQEDQDDDGAGNACDEDDDADGVVDAEDNCQYTANADQADNDEDNQGDVCEGDDDNDGVADDVDNCPFDQNCEQEDNDEDGQGDACDADDDNDGVVDIEDNCRTVVNEDQANNDEDGQGDACDADDDNDGTVDEEDNCPFVANCEQEDNDGDAQGDACDADDDNDGVIDDVDNCVFVVNPDQINHDSDEQGDACDEDDDNDGVTDALVCTTSIEVQCTPMPDVCIPQPPVCIEEECTPTPDLCTPTPPVCVPVEVQHCSGPDNCPFNSNPGQENNEGGQAAGDACENNPVEPSDDEDDGDSTNGSYRGSRTNVLRSILAMFGGQPTGVPPPAFGGPGDGEFTDNEAQLICRVRNAMVDDVTLDVYRWAAEQLSLLMPHSIESILDALRDGSVCPEPVAKVLKVAKPVAFHVDANGYPVSSNDTWNKCIRGTATLEDIRNNPDRDEDGFGYSCSRYHTQEVWQHPDLRMLFTWKGAAKGVTLPAGFALKQDQALTLR